jgi:hypothetical protein
MIEREAILTLADETAAALRDLRKRLSAPDCAPPIAVVGAVVTGLGAVKAKLARLDQAVKDAEGKGR